MKTTFRDQYGNVIYRTSLLPGIAAKHAIKKALERQDCTELYAYEPGRMRVNYTEILQKRRAKQIHSPLMPA